MISDLGCDVLSDDLIIVNIELEIRCKEVGGLIFRYCLKMLWRDLGKLRQTPIKAVLCCINQNWKATAPVYKSSQLSRWVGCSSMEQRILHRQWTLTVRESGTTSFSYKNWLGFFLLSTQCSCLRGKPHYTVTIWVICYCRRVDNSTLLGMLFFPTVLADEFSEIIHLISF
jgi:hypothetical protein